MIKIENTDVHGFEAAIRGMRNPMNSWDKSDSGYCEGRSARCDNCPIAPDDYVPCHAALSKEGKLYVVGEKDFTLMKQLVRAGSDHSKFMRMITVTCDITAPMYWWKEMDTYKVGTVRNSCSTMHKIMSKPFELNDFSHEHLVTSAKELLVTTIEALNNVREAYLTFDKNEEILRHQLDLPVTATREKCIKQIWWQVIQLLPSSYNQRATWQANYAVLRNIYHARKNHKLDCWREFCSWVETLPYAKELICDVD